MIRASERGSIQYFDSRDLKNSDYKAGNPPRICLRVISRGHDPKVQKISVGILFG